MKRILLALAIAAVLVPTVVFGQCSGVFPASTVCGTVNSGPPKPTPFTSFPLTIDSTGITGGTAYDALTVSPTLKLSQIPSYGVNIISFGADPTNVADSTAAIQAASDYATTTSGSIRMVYCPAGQYKTTLPIFNDPPGSLRGADGTHGQTWSNAETYEFVLYGNTVNYNGVPYLSLQAGNLNHQPDVSPTWWRPFNYNAGTTYGSGTWVRFNGIPWISLQAGNVGNTPAIGSAFWQSTAMWAHPDGALTTSFVGEPGLGNTAFKGCTLRPTSNAMVAFWVGAGNGNLAKDFNIRGPVNGFHGSQPSNGIGVAIPAGESGSNRAKVENVNVNNFYTLFQAGAGSFFALGAENTWEKVSGNNCAFGIVSTNGNSFINTVLDPSVECTTLFSFAGDGLTLIGGNWSQNGMVNNTFTISSVSALTSAVTSSGYYQYSFTAAVTAPDTYITSCGTNVGNCVYNSWVIRTAHFGLIPLTMTAWNSGTSVATFKTTEDWAFYFAQGIDALIGTDLQTDVQAVVTAYAIERSTILSASTAYKASGGWIEQDNSSCQTLVASGNLAAGVFENVRWNTDPSLTSAGNTANFFCQQSFPFIDMTGGTLELRNSYIVQNNSPPTTPQSPVVISLNASANRFVSNNNTSTLGQGLYLPVIRQLNSGGGFSISGGNSIGGPALGAQAKFDVNPFFPFSALSRQNSSVPYLGFRPAPWTMPRITSAVYASWRALGTIGGYLNANGNTFYSILDPLGLNQGQIVQSAHQFDSYGQTLNVGNIPTINLSWRGQSFAVLADAGTLSFVYPGLGVLLDNGGGNVRYIVTGVFPQVTLDGGTHPGYFTVMNATTDGVSVLLTGTKTVSYAATQISQDPYVWGNVGIFSSIRAATSSSCGTNPVTPVGNNLAGSFTTGTASPVACTLTLATAFPTSAFCTISPANSAAVGIAGGTYVSAQSKSAFTITLGAGTSSAAYNYTCSGF